MRLLIGSLLFALSLVTKAFSKIEGTIMNKTTVVIFAALVLLIIGYHLYPTLNEERLEESSSNSADLPTLLSKQPSVPQNIIQPLRSKNKTKTLTVSEQNFSDKSTVNLNQQQTPSVTSTAQTAPYSEETNVESPEQLAELKVWSENHKKNLKELVNKILPAERAQALMVAIMKNNPFLNEAVVKQDVYSDEEWSYKMTAIINNLILQHPYGLDIEVLSLTCKQLTCEMIVRQLVNGSWFEIYPDLMRYFLSNQYIIQTKDMKQFRFKNGEEYLFYQHLIFAK